MSETQTQDIQDSFLSDLIKSKVTTAIYLKSGIKLHGRITGFDHFTITLEEDTVQLIFKHAIATIVPIKS